MTNTKAVAPATSAEEGHHPRARAGCSHTQIPGKASCEGSAGGPGLALPCWVGVGEWAPSLTQTSHDGLGPPAAHLGQRARLEPGVRAAAPPQAILRTRFLQGSWSRARGGGWEDEQQEPQGCTCRARGGRSSSVWSCLLTRGFAARWPGRLPPDCCWLLGKFSVPCLYQKGLALGSHSKRTACPL